MNDIRLDGQCADPGHSRAWAWESCSRSDGYGDGTVGNGCGNGENLDAGVIA